MAFTLTVNGQSKTVDVPGDMPLLWVLRDVLSLKGTKFGCGIGQCGACTVHVNGKAQRACQTMMSTVGNAKVTTIEGLSPDGTHPLQVAWQEVDVPQCGYCQAGQIMAATALINRVKKSGRKISEADLDTLRNVCRCGSYPRIREAIKDAASNM